MELVAALDALGNPTRLRVFDLLMEGVQCNCEIAQRLGLALNLISYHMRALQRCGLVASRRDPEDGRWIYYSVSREALADLKGRLDALLDEGRIQPRAPNCGPHRACPG